MGCPRLGCTLTSDPLLPEMFDKQQANTIFWSPQGQFVVLAGLRRWVLLTPCAGLRAGEDRDPGLDSGPEGCSAASLRAWGQVLPQGIPTWVNRAVSPSCCPDVARTRPLANASTGD